MAEPYNVTIKRHNGNTWDIIYPKTTAENIISGTLNANRIPDLNANKITDGILKPAQIPGLDAEKIISGEFNAAQIPNLNANKITDGIIDVALLPAIALTNVMVDTTMTHFLATNYTGLEMQRGDVLILTEDKKTYIHNGGTAVKVTDFTLLQTPTDVVTSVAGKIGAVTLAPADVQLGNVPNKDATNPANITQNATYRFVSDDKIAEWNNKVTTVAGRTGAVTLAPIDVGLGSVDNTADSVKNVATATKWKTARTITLGGDASGSVSIDGSANVTLTVAVADDSHNHTIANIDNLQPTLNAKQTKIILLEDDLLSTYSSAGDGDVAFTY